LAAVIGVPLITGALLAAAPFRRGDLESSKQPVRAKRATRIGVQERAAHDAAVGKRLIGKMGTRDGGTLGSSETGQAVATELVKECR
jgi:hypothetical protein